MTRLTPAELENKRMAARYRQQKRRAAMAAPRPVCAVSSCCRLAMPHDRYCSNACRELDKGKS